MITFFVNNFSYSLPDNEGERRLVDFLREDLDLTGAKNACEIGACGACAIVINNEKVKICSIGLKDVNGKNILTIEGMENPDGSLHPLQQAFIDAGAIQCGFCTPGMVMASHAFLLKNNNPTREEIAKALIGNLCRCTGYKQIIDAVEMAAPFYQKNNN